MQPLSSSPQPVDCTALRPDVPRVVAIGGGTGLPNVLRGLRPLLYSPHDSAPLDQLVAIVTTTDDGGSSGRLRNELGIMPPGDIRNCLSALSETGGVIADLFQYRFGAGGQLDGHALGNLVLAALADVTNDFARAVEIAARVVGARGTVLPATAEPVILVAELDDGRTVRGETTITAAGTGIRRLMLCPQRPRCLRSAIDAIREADLIVVGPGSVYTSLLPPLLVPELADAIERSTATRVFVMNLMTEPGETDTFSAAEHLRTIARHVGRQLFDIVLYSTSPLSEPLVGQYGERGALPIRVTARDVEELSALGPQMIGVPLAVETAQHRIRHHPERLGSAIAAIARGQLRAWHARDVLPRGGQD
jgi:uncharacterized cofD-like protein